MGLGKYTTQRTRLGFQSCAVAAVAGLLQQLSGERVLSRWSQERHALEKRELALIVEQVEPLGSTSLPADKGIRSLACLFRICSQKMAPRSTPEGLPLDALSRREEKNRETARAWELWLLPLPSFVLGHTVPGPSNQNSADRRLISPTTRVSSS